MMFWDGNFGELYGSDGKQLWTEPSSVKFTMSTICTKDLTSEIGIMILENNGLLNETHRHVHVIHMYITICFLHTV